MDRKKAEEILKICKHEMRHKVDEWKIAGSWRRREGTFGDLDIIIIPKKGLRLQDCLPPSYDDINWLGEKKCQIVIKG